MNIVLGNRNILMGFYHLRNVGGLGFEITHCFDKEKGGYYGWFLKIQFVILNLILRITKQ